MFFLCATDLCFADIYKYVDERGIIHYTNIPTRGTYSLFIREKSRSIRINAPNNRYDKHIQEAARRHGVDFELIKAVIKVESAFNPRAVSKAGARGLMQVMPGNFSTLGIADPYNPRQSILGGTRYLRRMLMRFNGDLSLALAAYNAGPTAVEKYKKIPPYSETRTYVARVMKEFNRLRNAGQISGPNWQFIR